VFVTIEGGDGAGKTTLAAGLEEDLVARGLGVIVLREPGGTELGESLRSVLLDPLSRIDPRAEALLYAAARAQLVAEVIRPALGRGTLVICDRFVDSSLAYQGSGRELGVQAVGAANQLATGGLRPDLVFLLDVEPALGALRRSQPADRIESSGLAFHERVRSCFLEIARLEAERFVVLDASSPASEVRRLALRALESRLL
jgi:dTMP kinase